LASDGRIKVLVVDDSALMRRVIWGLLEQDPDIQVVGSAVDGQDAIERVHQLKPDVLTLDVEMPRLDGLQTLGYLMSESPVPCVMLSAYTPRGAETTLKALDYGATDFVLKPSGVISLDLERVKEELLAKIKVAKTIDLKRLPFRPSRPAEGPAGTSGQAPNAGQAPKRAPVKDRGGVVAIGTSTGGPRALAALLPALPADLPGPVLVVQHMSAGFTQTLAARLDRDCAIHVKEAEQGELLEAGTVYLAPGDWHMEVKREPAGVRVKLDQRPPVLGVRPCVDLLFNSVAEAYGPKALGVVLTGMGRDGAKGLKAMKAMKARTLAQDEASSVVYGMPRAAYASGAVDKVLGLADMAKAIVELMP
jgi:two-component system chemotaxis response regulator CheB